jgi:hypothetical protein
MRKRVINKVISMKTLIIKSLLTSLCHREVMYTVIYPSLAKRGKGRFFNNDALLMHSSVMEKFEDFADRYFSLTSIGKAFPF